MREICKFVCMATIVFAACTSEKTAMKNDSPVPTPAAAPAPTTPITTAPMSAPAANASSNALVVTPAIQAIIDAPDRTAADRALDAGRKPGEVLAFFNLQPGMKVAEIGASRGYTTELLVRAVGPSGTVYAQNPPAFVAGFLKDALPERLARPINAKVIRVDRDFASPLPDDARDLDAVVLFALYHDIVGMGVDRKAMNDAIFKALKPGGAYFIVDSSAKDGAGISEVKTLHRIEESSVRAEVQASGFRLDGSSDFLRNPADARDWNSSPSAAGERRGTSDRFALRFVKP